MAKKQKTAGFVLKTIFNVVMILLFVVAIIAIGFSISFLKNDKSETVKTAYGNTLTYAMEDEAGDKPYPIELNVFTNKAQNGIECYELRLNYYTDSSIPETEEEYKNVYSSGYQSLTPVTTKTKSQEKAFLGKYVDTTLITSPGYYYNSVFGESYKAIENLDYSNKWIFDYGDGKGLMLVSSRPEEKYRNFLWIKYFREIGINDFIKDIFEIVSLMDDGVHILPFKVDKYFNYKIYDTEEKKFIDEQADNKFLFFQAKITKSSDGLISASQSLFGQIANNTNYGVNEELQASYYRSLTVYSLTEDDFEFKPVTKNGVKYTFATLKEEAYDYLVNFSRMYIRVYLNLDNANLENIGFNENPFNGLDVDDILLTSSTPLTFYNFSPNTITTSGAITIIGGDEL